MLRVGDNGLQRLMRHVRLAGVLGLISVMGLIGCSELTPEEQASLAAKGFYRHLVSGQYELFLEGKAGADSLPDDYRKQLLTGYDQFVAQQERAHQGIREISVSSAKTDTLEGYTSVMLLLCYGDSTTEEIVVPMVENGGRWRMK